MTIRSKIRIIQRLFYMKQNLSILVIVLMSLVIPQKGYAYTFTSVAPSGQTLYYNLSGGTAIVTSSGTPGMYGSWLDNTRPTGNLVIPDSVIYQGVSYPVVSIGDFAFQQCGGLTSVTIPSTVNSIGNWSFSSCIGLDTVVIPNTVVFIGEGVFSGCSGISTATVPYLSIRVFYQCSSLTSIIITSPITSIGNYALYGCSSLSNFSIPSNVSSIGIAAFYGTNISSVTIPHGVTTIGHSAFMECRNLHQIFFNADSCISMGTANGNTVSPTYPSFYQDTSSISLIIGNNVKNIPEEAFSCCYGLSSVIIGDSVLRIGNNAFKFCHNIQSAVIPNATLTIGDYAFYGASGLNTLTIGSSVTSIGNYAFGCQSLSSITMRCYPPSITSSTFINVTRNIPVHTPCGALTSYQNAQYWNTFTHFVNGCVSITVTSNDYTRGGVSGSGTYTLGDSVTLTAIPFSGHLFVGWSNGSQDNPLEFVATQDQSLVAAFVPGPLPRDTIYLHDTTILHDTIVVNHNDTAVVYITDTLWLNDTIYMYDTIIIHDTIYITGVDNAEPLEAKIYTHNGHIIVEGTQGYPVTLYDAVGRLLVTKETLPTGNPCELPVTTTGVYLVKIGSYPARRIVIRR